MSIAEKLYQIGNITNESDIKEITEVDIETREDFQSYETIVINYDSKNNQLSKFTQNIATLNTFFTKKIGGTSNSYYLYPNLELIKEKNIYKKFLSLKHTFINSILIYSDESNRELAEKFLDKILNYDSDYLNLKEFKQGNYFLILTVDKKSLTTLMPEIWKNYYNSYVKTHIIKKIKKVDTPYLKITNDFFTNEKIECGYNPDIKFFTFDNYHDKLKPRIVEHLPLSKESATNIKKGWIFTLDKLKFYYKGLSYIILPSMINYDEKIYKKAINFLKKSKNLKNIQSREGGFIHTLSEQIDEIDEKILLNIYFVDINITNLSVKIFASLEDVTKSKISKLVENMDKYQITDSISVDKLHKKIYLRDYFLRVNLFANAKKVKGIENRALQEKIYLAKILLGFEQISKNELLKRFEFNREFNFEHKKRLTNEGIKEWIEFPSSFVKSEKTILEFLQKINAIKE